LLNSILEDPKSLARWDEMFGNRRLHSAGFNKALYMDLIDGKLSLKQVGALLLRPKGECSRIGCYYDATSSAYQILGVINKNPMLCELTNVGLNSTENLTLLPLK
jgi:hypothetical protein